GITDSGTTACGLRRCTRCQSSEYLERTIIDGEHIDELLATHRMVGVPYTDEMIENAVADFAAQADPDSDFDALLERYPGAQVRSFDGAEGVSEADALIAYMQMLGTLVDFSTFVAEASR
ncbi:MAG: cbb3-type cytochrome c oxidase subunit II, partial [Pseudomonadota bacterium]